MAPLFGTFLRALAGDVAQLLFPRVCLACERPVARGTHAFVCPPCWARVAPLPHPRCERCGHPATPARPCQWCAHLHPAVAAARSFCWADDPVGQTLVHALKYHGWHGVAGEMADRMARLDFGPATDRVLVPVPLAAGRLRERGYNQGARLAESLAERWRAASCASLLERTRETTTQTRLTAEQRLHNVASAFRVDATRLARLGTAELFLVDDVVTTGATLNACADALANAGAGRISYITFSRARDPRDPRPSRGTAADGNSRRHQRVRPHRAAGGAGG